MIIRDVIKELLELDPEMTCAYDLWTFDDIRELADDNTEHNLTDAMINKVLENAQDNLNVRSGLSWDVFIYEINQIMRGYEE